MAKQRKKKRKIKSSFFIYLLLVIATIYILYSITLFKNIENTYRILACLIIVAIAIICLGLMLIIKSNKKKKIKALNIFMIVLSFIYVLLGYYANSIYNKLGNINTNLSKGLSLITTDNKLKEANIKDNNIAHINLEDNTELESELLSKANIDESNKLVDYKNLEDIKEDLFDKKVNLAIVPSNYNDIYRLTKEESNKIIEIATVTKTLKKETKMPQASDKPFTVLLLGIDSTAANLNNADSFNGDSLNLVTVNPKTLKATIVTVPRDSYVPIMCLKGTPQRKINQASLYSTDCMLKTMSNMLKVNIDYYVKINFTGVVTLIDILGGIDVDVPYAFCEQNSHRQFGNQTIYIEKGMQHLNGEAALALARNRKYNSSCGKKYNEGRRDDFVRGDNQQRVIEATLKKLKEVKSLDKLKEILNTLTNYIDTNMPLETIFSYYDLAKAILTKTTPEEQNSLLKLEHLKIEGNSQNILEESSGYRLSYVIPTKGSLDDVVHAMKGNLELIEKTPIKEFSYDPNDPYNKTAIGKGNFSGASKYTLLPYFVGMTKEKALQTANNLGLTVKFIEKEGTEDKVIKQSPPSNKRLDRMKTKEVTLTIEVPKKEEEDPDKSNGDKLDCTLEKYKKDDKCKLKNFKTKDEYKVWLNSFTKPIINTKYIDEDAKEIKDTTKYNEILHIDDAAIGKYAYELTDITITLKTKDDDDNNKKENPPKEEPDNPSEEGDPNSENES